MTLQLQLLCIYTFERSKIHQMKTNFCRMRTYKNFLSVKIRKIRKEFLKKMYISCYK